VKDDVQAAIELRAFLAQVKAAGELKEIAGANWDLEIGALTEIFAGTEPAPALLFVVDEDIDITNVNELMWAMASRWDQDAIGDRRRPGKRPESHARPGKKRTTI
jgi:3-polyprenyl-4-hydroxybenzoate decarboxylase